MWRLVLWLVVAACGRSNFDTSDNDGGIDVTPDPIVWPDFENLSAAPAFTGINQAIDIQLEVTNAAGTPTVRYVLAGGAAVTLTAGTPSIVSVEPGATLQFLITGTASNAAVITVSNVTTGGTLLDSVLATAASLVTGDGSLATPFAPPGAPPASCNAFLAGHPEQLGADGYYLVSPGVMTTVYCDMTTDTGGWTLVARVLGASTTHVTAAAVGNLIDPTQATTAKLSDAMINALQHTHARIRIEGLGAVYALVASLDLSGASFSLMNASAATLAGPYIYRFQTSTGCAGDCGVAQAVENLGFGTYCGYRYYASAGNPRNGMGCQGNFARAGTVWVK